MAYWWRRRHRRRPRRGTWRRAHRRWRRPRRRWTRKRHGRRRFRRRGRGRRRARKVRFRKLYRRPRARVLRQWEPNSQTYCKISGTEQGLMWGNMAPFRIMCDNQPWPIRTGEWEGGSMNLLQHTLEFLYTDNVLMKNRWSRSNAGYDLCRYLGTRFWFPRHPTLTYIVILLREGHFTLEDGTYQMLHPEMMIHAKRKLIVWSQQLRPRSKPYVKVRIPPPQLLQTKWYFQRDFCKIPLFTLLISAIDPINNILSGAQYNSSILLYGFPYYSRPMPYDTWLDWALKCWGPQTEPWIDRKTYAQSTIEGTKWATPDLHTVSNEDAKTMANNYSAWAFGCEPLLATHFGLRSTSVLIDYDRALNSCTKTAKRIAISVGRWNPNWPDNWAQKDNRRTQTPFTYRYSWREDMGKGNKIMLYTRECREGVPEADNKLEDKPLYILCNGYFDYILKHSSHNPLNWVVVVWCPYTFPPMEGVIPVDKDWFNGVLTYGENEAKEKGKDLIRGWDGSKSTQDKNLPYTKDKCKWNTAITKDKNANNDRVGQNLMQGSVARCPDVIDSEKFFKALYEGSPWSYKYTNIAGNVFFWYQSRWKWGGDFQKQKPVEDPCNKPKWGTLPISNYDERGVQIQNPKETKPGALLHDWDLRRGDLTVSALKRLMQLDSTDTDPEHSPQKKKRRAKEPLTAEEKVQPEDVYLYLPSPPRYPAANGKTARDTFVDRFGNGTAPTKSLAEEVYKIWEETQKNQHYLRKYLRQQRHRMDQYRLLLG
nr:ORF1 [Epsilontorquevirus sp.]